MNKNCSFIAPLPRRKRKWEGEERLEVNVVQGKDVNPKDFERTDNAGAH